MFSLKHLQEEQKSWVQHNFPDRDDWMPLLGLMEELGEMIESFHNDNLVKDAIADMTIFLTDYCTALNFNVEELWNNKSVSNVPVSSEFEHRLIILIGKIAHSHLKMSQKIRISKDHLGTIKDSISNLLHELDDYVLYWFKQDLASLVEPVWNEVRKRDWKKDPVNANR